MNETPKPPNLLRIMISVIGANIVASMVAAPFPLYILVFVLAYMAISYLYDNTAGKLIEENLPKKEGMGMGMPQPGPLATEIEPLKDQLTHSLSRVVLRLEPEELNERTRFVPIREGETTLPYLDFKKNQVHITRELFVRWVGELEREFLIRIPEDKINEWVLHLNLGQIQAWIDEQPVING